MATTTPVLQRSSRDRQPSSNAQEYVLLTYSGEPESYQEVHDNEQKQDWYKTMEEEMDSLKNHMNDLMKIPNDKRTLKNKQVFILK